MNHVTSGAERLAAGVALVDAAIERRRQARREMNEYLRTSTAAGATESREIKRHLKRYNDADYLVSAARVVLALTTPESSGDIARFGNTTELQAIIARLELARLPLLPPTVQALRDRGIVVGDGDAIDLRSTTGLMEAIPAALSVLLMVVVGLMPLLPRQHQSWTVESPARVYYVESRSDTI